MRQLSRAGRPPKEVNATPDGYVKLPPAGKGSIKLPKWDGQRRGHRIPDHPHDPAGWHKQTLIWWTMWRDSSHAMFFLETDWEQLFVTAILHDTLMKGCSHTAMAALTAQITRREGMLGASVEDRIRLGMSSEQTSATVTESEVQKGVKEVVNYAQRVGDALNGST